MYADQFAEEFDDAVGTNASRYINRKTFARKFIDDGQTFQLLPIGASIKHKIVSPHLVGPKSGQWARPPACDPSPRPLSRYLEARIAPDSMYAIGAHHMTLSFQEYLNASIAVARVLCR